MLVRSKQGWQFQPFADGPARPVPGLALNDLPIQWSPDGRFVYALDQSGGRATLDISRTDVVSGQRVVWK
jgi:hypothetical protein